MTHDGRVASHLGSRRGKRAARLDSILKLVPYGVHDFTREEIARKAKLLASHIRRQAAQPSNGAVFHGSLKRP